MVTSSPLVLTKFHLPAFRQNIMPRPHLIESMLREERFILISAAAGYGKTTLMLEYARRLVENDVAVAWYALDASDDDSLPFAAYLSASLAHALGGSIPELAQLAQRLRSSPEVDVQAVIQSIINLVVCAGHECALLLDDYHLISSPAIHSAFVYLLEHLPQNVQVVLGSRADPPFPLARMRAGGSLFEIRTAQLRFTQDESETYLNRLMKLSLSVQEVAALDERSEGWAAGLQLAALSLAGRPDKEAYIASFSGSHRFLVEYLLDEVVNRQTQEVQSFLLVTSVLGRMCAPLCDALIGEDYPSETILAGLVQSNLFLVALDDEGYWYRYHHLFRDFLLARLQKEQPGRANLLHKAASEWLASRQLLREAAQHAFQSGDWEYAAAFVAEHSFNMIIYSEISTIYEWCSAFPEEVMQRHPLLLILQCWSLVLSFRRQNRPRVEARLRQVEQLLAGIDDPKQVSELSEHAAIVRTFLSMAPDLAADPRQLLASSQRMLAAYEEGDPAQFSSMLTLGYAHMALHDTRAGMNALERARQAALNGGLFFGIAESTFHLARLLHSQGNLQNSAELCRRTRTEVDAMLAHSAQHLPASGCLDVALGCVLLERDQLAEAQQHLLHGLDLLGHTTNPNYLMTAYTALARSYEIQNRPQDMMKYLVELEESWSDISFLTHALRILFALRSGRLNDSIQTEAAAWCRDYSIFIHEDMPLPGTGPFGAADAFYQGHLAWLRMQITLGKARAARPLLERMLDLAGKSELAHRVMELSLIEALAARAEGDDARAHKALEAALEKAQPQGYIRSFDRGVDLTRLLQDASSGIYHDYIERILAAIQSCESSQRVDTAEAPSLISSQDGELLESLSERELEVLRLMEGGATNQLIADRLVITVGTVKSHINHILRKLSARNRTEAVARARRLDLL